MFYALYTQKITTTVTQHQVCKFYDKAHRDEFCAVMPAKPISAREKAKHIVVGQSRTCADDHGVFFAIPVMLSNAS